MTSYFAAIDSSDHCGAVYGTGTSESEALDDAQRGAAGDYEIVPCSAEAYEYVQRCGGEPDSRLTVARTGVTLEAPECRGHPAGPYDPMGVTVYCDGTCRK